MTTTPESASQGQGAISALLQEDRRYEPSAKFRAAANVSDPGIYERARRDPEAFWAERAKELAGIPGAVPSPLRPPAGCRFHPRCPEAREACRIRRPDAISVGPDREVACVLYEGGSA